MSAYRTIADTKVVYVPVGERIDAKGRVYTVFARTGIRVDMANGSWWFKCFRTDTWSRHYTALEAQGRGFNRKAVPIELSDPGLTPSAMARVWGHNPELLNALSDGELLALAADAAK